MAKFTSSFAPPTAPPPSVKHVGYEALQPEDKQLVDRFMAALQAATRDLGVEKPELEKDALDSLTRPNGLQVARDVIAATEAWKKSGKELPLPGPLNNDAPLSELQHRHMLVLKAAYPDATRGELTEKIEVLKSPDGAKVAALTDFLRSSAGYFASAVVRKPKNTAVIGK